MAERLDLIEVNRIAVGQADALTAPVEEDLDELELFNQNDEARKVLEHERHVRELTSAAR